MNDILADGSRDGRGAGDRDLPYTFGLRLTYGFTVRQFARLLMLRARLGDQTLLRVRPHTTPLLEAE